VSAQRTGQADTVLMLAGEKVDGRTVSTTVVFAKLREEPDEYPAPVTYSIAKNDAGKARLRILSAAGGEDDGRPLEERIISALGVGVRTKSSLAEQLHRSRTDVDEALTTLFSARRIESTSTFVRGKTVKAFKVRDVIPRTSTRTNWADEGSGRTLGGLDRTEQ
jgi:hypothetical protein